MVPAHAFQRLKTQQTLSFFDALEATSAFLKTLMLCTRRSQGMWVYLTFEGQWRAARAPPFDKRDCVVIENKMRSLKKLFAATEVVYHLHEGVNKYLDAPSFTYDPRSSSAGPTLNLFRGFAASSSPLVTNGNVIIQPILDHIRTVWADGDEDTYAYIMSWLATIAHGRRTGVALLIYNLHTDYLLEDIFRFFGSKVFGDTNSSVSSTICVRPPLTLGRTRYKTQLKGGVPGCVFIGFYELLQERDCFDNKRVSRDMGDLVTRDTVELELYVNKTNTLKSTTPAINCANLLMTGLFRNPVREHSWMRQLRGGHVHDPDRLAKKTVHQATQAVGAGDAMMQHLLTLAPLVA